MTDAYGWYLVLKEVAESGIFNIAGLTAIKSAEIAPLYEVFQYLSASKAEQEFINKMHEK